MAKRRPGRDPAEKKAVFEENLDSIEVVDVEAVAAPPEPSQSHEDITKESATSGQVPPEAPPKVELPFPGGELLREQFPQVFEVVDQVATDWVHDGRFEGLPLGHPLLSYFAGKGLRRAKQIEKKVAESPVTEKIVMQAFTAGMKAQEIFQQVRSKVRPK
jgi:hypothetical protein